MGKRIEDPREDSPENGKKDLLIWEDTMDRKLRRASRPKVAVQVKS